MAVPREGVRVGPEGVCERVRDTVHENPSERVNVRVPVLVKVGERVRGLHVGDRLSVGLSVPDGGLRVYVSVWEREGRLGVMVGV